MTLWIGSTNSRYKKDIMVKKVAFITGGNRGLGYETAMQLAEAGYAVFIGSRNKENGEEAARKIKEATNNEDVWAVATDLSNQSTFSEALKTISSRTSKLDILIHNAAIFPNYDDSTSVDMDQLKSVFDTNVWSAIALSRALLPVLSKSQDARIVHVSSGMGDIREPNPTAFAYRMSKAGINAATVFMGADVKSSGVSVVSVCPGWCRTDMGGSEAPRSSKQGGRSIFLAATQSGIESGSFYRDGVKVGF